MVTGVIAGKTSCTQMANVGDLYTPTCILRPENRVTCRPSLSKQERLETNENGLKWHF
jgi:hypothetical protein